MNMIHRYGGGDSEEIERQIGNADNVELFYFDTTGDGMLSAWDALLMINKLIDDTFNPNPTPVADAFFSEFADDEEELVAGEPALF